MRAITVCDVYKPRFYSNSPYSTTHFEPPKLPIINDPGLRRRVFMFSGFTKSIINASSAIDVQDLNNQSSDTSVFRFLTTEYSNRGLELLGDALLGFLVTDVLIDSLPFAFLGEIDLLKRQLTSNKTFKLMAKEWYRLDKYRLDDDIVQISRGCQSLPSSKSKESDLFEAYIGALFLDLSNVTNWDQSISVIRQYVSQIIGASNLITELGLNQYDSSFKECSTLINSSFMQLIYERWRHVYSNDSKSQEMIKYKYFSQLYTTKDFIVRKLPTFFSQSSATARNNFSRKIQPFESQQLVYLGKALTKFLLIHHFYSYPELPSTANEINDQYIHAITEPNRWSLDIVEDNQNPLITSFQNHTNKPLSINENLGPTQSNELRFGYLAAIYLSGISNPGDDHKFEIGKETEFNLSGAVGPKLYAELLKMQPSCTSKSCAADKQAVKEDLNQLNCFEMSKKNIFDTERFKEHDKITYDHLVQCFMSAASKLDVYLNRNVMVPEPSHNMVSYTHNPDTPNRFQN